MFALLVALFGKGVATIMLGLLLAIGFAIGGKINQAIGLMPADVVATA